MLWVDAKYQLILNNGVDQLRIPCLKLFMTFPIVGVVRLGINANIILLYRLKLRLSRVVGVTAINYVIVISRNLFIHISFAMYN